MSLSAAQRKAKPVPPMTAVAPGFWPKLLGRRLDLRNHGVETATEVARFS
jgi:hypothetical protein